MEKLSLVSFLDKFLKLEKFECKDSSKNGLQVDTFNKDIKRIGYAVDATSYIFDLAVDNNIDLILVHHGIFWGKETRLIDIYYERIYKLVKNNIGLYACHLPLDVHPVVGNNIGILISLVNNLTGGDYRERFDKILNTFESRIDEILDCDGVVYEDDDFIIEKFGKYSGFGLGYGIRFKKQKFYRTQIVSPFAEIMGFKKIFYNFGKKEFFSSVSILSGSGGDVIIEAKKKNFDIFLTGELTHWQYTFAKEIGQSIFIGGHRETEKIGPKLLAYYLRKKFGVEIIFLDEKY